MNMFFLENIRRALKEIQPRTEIIKHTTFGLIPELSYEEPQRFATFTKKDLAMLGA